MTNFSGMEERIKNVLVHKLRVQTKNPRLNPSLVKVAVTESDVIITLTDNNVFNTVAAAHGIRDCMRETETRTDELDMDKEHTRVFIHDTPLNVEKKLGGRICEKSLHDFMAGATPAYAGRG